MIFCNLKIKKMKKIVIGGTFDLLHKGHKALISKAFEEGEVYLGLTSNEMAQEMKNREVDDFEKRQQALEEYVSQELSKEIEIKKIDDLFGFAVDQELDAIIVSPETEKNALLINAKRQETGKNALEVLRIDLVLADDGQPISSTRIRNKEIDQEGKVL
jgi:pantetheine-phosphate adenylyltransferase